MGTPKRIRGAPSARGDGGGSIIEPFETLLRWPLIVLLLLEMLLLPPPLPVSFLSIANLLSRVGDIMGDCPAPARVTLEVEADEVRGVPEVEVPGPSKDVLLERVWINGEAGEGLAGRVGVAF